jgi:hypothetical protein
MEFSEYAANETSALIAALLARRSQESLASFLAFRKALDEVTRTIEAWAHVEQNDEVADHVRRLAAEAQALADHRGEIAKGTIDGLREQLQAIELKLAASDDRAEVAETESGRLRQRLDAETSERQKLSAALDEARNQLRAVDEQRLSLANQLNGTSAQISALRNANVENERSRRDLQTRLDAALATEASLRHRIADGELEMARARMEAQSTNLTAVSLSVDRLLTGFEQLAAANTTPDILAALASALASDFSRVALFSVKGKRLEGVLQIGFESTSDISKIVIPLTPTSLLAKAMLSDRVEAFPADELDASVRGPFGGTPEYVLALPIAVNGETLAVVYADDSGQSKAECARPSDRAKFAELLRRYAIPCLAKHAPKAERPEELSTYAKLLLDEVEGMFSADLAGGVSGADLQNRLEDNLRSARQFYRRVATDPAAASLFDERLASLMAKRTGTSFGRVLSAIALRSSSAVNENEARAGAGAV